MTSKVSTYDFQNWLKNRLDKGFLISISIISIISNITTTKQEKILLLFIYKFFMALNSRFNLLKQIFFNEEKEKMETKNKIEVVKIADSLNIPKTFKSEFHFLKFPFFDLSPRASKKDKIEIKEKETTEEGEIEVLWKVVRGLERDFPSILARKIHKEVIEKILNNIKKPIPRLIKLGSLRKICREMNIAESGSNFEKIKKALKDIKAAEIEAKGTFRQKEKNGIKKFFEGNFNLYDMVFFTGETLPSGKGADAVYILLNDMYVQNFNYNFVVPLDYPYFKYLKGDIASRMYEVLSVWFYPALENGRKYIQKEYSEICNYFPLTRQNTKKKAKGQLRKAHQQHISNKFLGTEPEWIDIGEENDWLIRYWIGAKAKEWHKQNKRIGYSGQEIKQLKRQEEGKERKKGNKQQPLINKLSELGITKQVAENLVENKDPEIIKGWTKAVYETNAKDKAAFVVKAIEENWQLPEIFKKKKQTEQKQLHSKALEKEQKKLAEQQTAYSEYIKSKIEKYKTSISQDQYQKEIEEIKKHLFEKYPWIKTQHWEGPIIQSTAEANYKDWLIEQNKIKILSFEEWKKEREKGPAIAVK